MSETPPHSGPLNGRDRTPELASKREKRHREDDEDDRDSSHRRHRRHEGEEDDEERERERERERRHRRHREEREREREGAGAGGGGGREDDRDRERRHRHRYDDETEEEREERRRRRKERELREREREREYERGHDDRSHRSRDYSPDRERERERDRDRDRSHRERDRSRESHRSHRSKDVDGQTPAIREMSREEKERERERRDREMAEERREAARQRDERFAEREPYSPRRRRDSPSYDTQPGGPRQPPPPPPPKDPAQALIEEVDSENRSVFVSQIAARMTSQDLGMFFEDKLGRGAVRDARIVTDRVSRRSKGIGYVELDDVNTVNKAISLSGTIVMGIPIIIQLTEAERNREGKTAAQLAAEASKYLSGPSTGQRSTQSFQVHFPPLSTGLRLPQGLDPDAHQNASVPYHRLFVTSVAYSLGIDDLRAVFEPFGELEFVDLHTDYTGQSKGTAYVQFRELRAAQMALDAMNGFELAGRQIRVMPIQERSMMSEQIEDSGTGYGGPRMDAAARQQLMFKLARTEPTPGSGAAAPARPAPTKAAPVNPTPYLVVSNMFNPEDETERNWDLDLAEDVKGEVERQYGHVRRIKVDKMSAGEVYIEFGSVDDAERALKGLGGRFFGGRQLAASFISEALFRAHL
ncbi:hypothetical protein JCM24511_07554 [Saitozyma sp. JCM 24511]|nr:hypothetical protein JCM24511_07554 [Saitozyma sp. JCM 24511]